jgi:antirestriction protein ArdC
MPDSKERPVYGLSRKNKESGKEKLSTYDIVTEKISNRLEQGDIPWKKPWKARLPRNLITNKPYQGMNLLLLSDQDYSNPYWLTFTQAREKGGHVKRGEKGSLITFWKVTEKELEEKEGKELRFLLRHYTVFNLEQCEGIESPPVGEKIDPIKKCEDIISDYKTAPEVRTNNRNKAYYSPSGDYVSLPPKYSFNSSEGYYASLFHEMTHSTGHEKRLGRFNSKDYSRPFAGEEYSKEELIAELGSAFLCAEAGIDNSELDNSAAYIQSWLKALRNDKRLLISASSQAAKATRYILGQTDEG